MTKTGFKLASSLLAISILMASNIYAGPANKKQPKTNNQVDNGYQGEKGYYFYDDPANAEEQNKSQNPNQYEQPTNTEQASSSKGQQRGVEAILAELLKEAKKQTKLQTEIRDILKEQFAPEPKLMVKEDGTQCIENSSSDCYAFPLIAEAKRVPVMANWLSNPNTDTAKEWLKWQAKYFGQIFDIGSSLQFAIAQHGTEAYPIGFQRAGFDSTGGVYSEIKDKFNKKLVNKLGSTGKISLTYYIGKNIDLDIFAMDNIARLMSELPDVKIALVFSDAAAQKVYNDGSNTFIEFKKAIANGNISTKISPEDFKTYKIKTTPTLFVSYNSNGTVGFEALENGKYAPSDTIEKILEFAEYKKIVDRKERADENVWPSSGNYSSEYLKSSYGIELDKRKIRGYYGK